MEPLAQSIEIKVTDTVSIETIAPGGGVYINKRPGAGKSQSITLSAPEFRVLHRAMAAAEPFIIDG